VTARLTDEFEYSDADLRIVSLSCAAEAFAAVDASNRNRAPQDVLEFAKVVYGWVTEPSAKKADVTPLRAV